MEDTFQFQAAAGEARITQTERWIAPGSFRQDSVTPGGNASVYLSGQSGWISAPQGSGELTGTALQQVRGDLFRSLFPMLLSDRLPDRSVNSVDENTVEVRDGSGQAAKLLFDPATGLLQTAVYDTVTAAGQVVSVTRSYTDYRSVGTLKLPFKMTLTIAGQKYADVTVQAYQVNAGLKVQDLERRP